ncbi:MAG: hypothetical protein ACI8P3_001839 [Saprospiraceae bacterium]|jgi:hypothetical protein
MLMLWNSAFNERIEILKDNNQHQQVEMYVFGKEIILET